MTALAAYHATVPVYDPRIDAEAARRETGCIRLAAVPSPATYDAVVVAVGHRQFVEAGLAAAHSFGKPHAVLYDVKDIFAQSRVAARL